MDPQREALARFNFTQKYARYNAEKRRRETWEEAIGRVMTMHREHLGEHRAEDLQTELETIERMMLDKKILGSQRSLQFGGRAVLEKHARSYNCTSCYVDNVSRFSQALYLLLCGAGVGYSVQDHHVAQLPKVNRADQMTQKGHYHHVIPDTIEGWADAFEALMQSYTGDHLTPSFDFSEIRAYGTPISSCGGKAPSAYPLRVALSRAEALLITRAGQPLKPSDASDLMCILADCVLAGGVRRSALLCMFSVDTVDPEMMRYKARDQWWTTHPYRARANISAVVLRDDPQAHQKFKKVFEKTKNYGEPAVIWVDSTEVAYNPCVEIGMCPTLIFDPDGEVVENYSRELLDPQNRDHYREQGYTFETAFQFCNLCEINMSAWETVEDAESAVYFATVLGCIQASYTGTEGDYLSKTATRAILERESLLGVSLTGIATAPEWARAPELLRRLAYIATATASKYWERCGLESVPARVTCVKPSGNASVNLGCSSGIHPEHAHRYIRRVQVPRNSPIVQAFSQANPLAVESCMWTSADDVTLAFAVEAPEGALTRDKQSAREFLEQVRLVQENWVYHGTNRPDSVEGLTHNVSNTCTVRPHEWGEVADLLIDGRAVFGGVSCLGASGDYDYPQAPLRAIYTEVEDDDPHAVMKRAEANRWRRLRAMYVEIDYSQIIELSDNTELMREGACFGGSCDL